MIESVELVLAALSAGAAAGATTTASTAVTDAYEGLKSLTRKALGRDDVDNPAELRDELTEAGVDEELIAAARRVLELTGAKYQIDVHDNQGVQVGENNTMNLHFGK